MRTSKYQPEQIIAYRVNHTLEECALEFQMSIRQINRICTKNKKQIDFEIGYNRIRRHYFGKNKAIANALIKFMEGGI